MKKNGLLAIAVMLCMVIGFSTPVFAASGKPIKIGVLGPMDYDFGKLIWYGAEMAKDKINGAGGINVAGEKRPVKIVKINTNEMTSITDAIAAAEKALMIDRVDMLTGCFRSESTLAVQDRIMDEKKIFISSGPASPLLTMRVKKNYDRYKYYFRVNMNIVPTVPFFFEHAAYVAKTLREELGLKKLTAAVLADKATFADPAVKAFSAGLPKMGIEVVKVIRISPVATDVTAEMTAIKSSGAHIVMQMLTGPAGASVGRIVGELKIPTALTGINVLAQSKALWEATGGKGEYITTGTAYGRAPLTPSTISFFDEFDKRYNEFPGHGGFSHEAIMVYKAAVERAGSIDSDKVVTALEKTDYLGSAYRIVFRGMDDPFPHDVKTGAGYGIAPLLQWVDGKQLVIWPHKMGDITYKGIHKYQIPPWMIKHYKK